VPGGAQLAVTRIGLSGSGRICASVNGEVVTVECKKALPLEFLQYRV